MTTIMLGPDEKAPQVLRALLDKATELGMDPHVVKWVPAEGGAIDVPDELAEAYLAQGKEAEADKPRKRAAKKAAPARKTAGEKTSDQGEESTDA